MVGHKVFGLFHSLNDPGFIRIGEIGLTQPKLKGLKSSHVKHLSYGFHTVRGDLSVPEVQ